MASNITYSVDYETASGRIVEIEFGARYRAACAKARKLSDEHGSAYVVASRPEIDEEEGDTVSRSCGHVHYWCGARSDVEGIVRCAA